MRSGRPHQLAKDGARREMYAHGAPREARYSLDVWRRESHTRTKKSQERRQVKQQQTATRKDWWQLLRLTIALGGLFELVGWMVRILT